MAFYGMHDAPGGKQQTNTFLNNEGMPLKVGDKKDFLIPWYFLNPFSEETLYRNGFLTNDGYSQNPDLDVLKGIIQDANNFISESPVNRKWIKGKNSSSFSGYIDTILNSPNKLRQAYMAISMRAGDYIYIRGKRGIINQGWIFKINDPTDFKYLWFKNVEDGGEHYRQFFTLEVVCRVPNSLYDKLQARRASIWKLSENDRDMLRNLIN